MQFNQEPLRDRLQTARRIKHLCEEFYLDLTKATFYRNGKKQNLSDLTLPQFFHFVKNIPYRKDPSPREIVARPYYLIKHRALGLDCKKKGALICAYLRIKNYKYRAIGSSNRPDKKIHHIYFELYDHVEKKWKPVDATYSHYKLFQEKSDETAREVLK